MITNLRIFSQKLRDATRPPLGLKPGECPHTPAVPGSVETRARGPQSGTVLDRDLPPFPCERRGVKLLDVRVGR